MRIRKNFKFIFTILILILAIVLSSEKTVFAGTEINAGGGSEGSVDVHSSVSGFSKNRSGYLIYITDAAGTPVSDIKLVPYSSAPASNVNKQGLRTRVTLTPYTGIYTGNIRSCTNGGFVLPPINTATGEVAGEAMKAWFVADDDGNGSANVYTLIGNLFGEDMKTAFRDNDYYLCVEAVVWMGLQSSANPTMVAGTTMTLNQLFRAVGSNYMNFFRQSRLPHAMHLIRSWAGCTTPTIHSGQKESLADLTAPCNGYGMIMCRSSEVDTPTETPDPEPIEVASDDYLKADELNFSFPDFIKSSTDGRSSEHYSTINDGNNKFDMGASSVWNNHTGDGYQNSALKDNKWSVSESIISDLVSFYGKSNCLFYRATAGQWANPSASKTFAGDVIKTCSPKSTRNKSSHIFGVTG